jgi:hypothetical protein
MSADSSRLMPLGPSPSPVAKSSAPDFPRFLDCLVMGILRGATSRTDDREGRKVGVVRSSQPGTGSRRQVDLSCRSFAHLRAHARIHDGHGRMRISYYNHCRTKLSRVKTKSQLVPVLSPLSRTGTECYGADELRTSELRLHHGQLWSRLPPTTHSFADARTAACAIM